MNQIPEDTGQSNLMWGETVASCLSKLQVSQVFFSPGSRSTPLVLAFERHPKIECIPILDERSAAFLALGSSKRSNLPTLLLCTSGSAPTHWFPAVTEASHASIPLLLLSADRPPELQDCGAGQTIDQVNLFGSFVRAFHQVPLPKVDHDSIVNLINIVSLAHRQTIGTNPGPVHLNFPFREPLLAKKQSSNPKSPELTIHLDAPPLPSLNDPETISLAGKYKRPILIAGEFLPSKILSRWTSKNPLPILCDALSSLRENSHENRILRYENLLRNSTFLNKSKPDLILAVGPLPTSKTLRNWIDQTGADRFVFDPRGKSIDPLSSKSQSFQLNYQDLDKIRLPVCEDNWVEMWKLAEEQVEKKLSLAFAREVNFFEGKIPRLLSEHMPADSSLQIANSMPIRDAEWFWKPSHSNRKLFGNRGVNGIDGSISTSLGIAHLREEPTFLLIGDLAFLHDCNALLFRKIFKGSLTIFLINNDGGGIFENLSVSKVPEFEKCFATPQSCDFSTLCDAHEVDYKKPVNWEEVVRLIENPIKCGIRVIEIHTNRKKDRGIRSSFLSLCPEF